MKLLITSVGSLVGKNILDVLEFPGWSRRHLVRVVGTNSIADAPNNFRCDRCYLVPATAAAEYPARVREILRTESPDLILCGRDEDTLTLSQLKAGEPDLPGALPVATPRTALIGLDKWETYQFSRRHGLPFAESFLAGASSDRAALAAFCTRVGYPLIAKPVRGFASKGVHFVRDAQDLEVVARRTGYLVQEYLGDAQALQPYFESLRALPPLYTQPPNVGHYSCQTVIASTGELAPVLVLYTHLEYGMALSSTRVCDPSLESLTVAYGRALAREGVVGPVNVAFRRDRDRNWKVQEINLRNTGSTLARFLIGMDELYLIVRDFVPGAVFPELRPSGVDHVSKALSSYALPKSGLQSLRSAGVWSNEQG